MIARLCTYCGEPTPLGLRIPHRLAASDPWQVFYCPTHRDEAEAARAAEMQRRGLK